MSQRRAVTKTIATRCRRGGQGRQGRDLGRAMCRYGLASQQCPQGADAGSATEDRSPECSRVFFPPGRSSNATLEPEPSHARRAVSYTHLRAHETDSYLVCRLLLEKK